MEIIIIMGDIFSVFRIIIFQANFRKDQNLIL